MVYGSLLLAIDWGQSKGLNPIGWATNLGETLPIHCSTSHFLELLNDVLRGDCTEYRSFGKFSWTGEKVDLKFQLQGLKNVILSTEPLEASQWLCLELLFTFHFFFLLILLVGYFFWTWQYAKWDDGLIMFTRQKSFSRDFAMLPFPLQLLIWSWRFSLDYLLPYSSRTSFLILRNVCYKFFQSPLICYHWGTMAGIISGLM